MRILPAHLRQTYQKAFTLVEMAVVLVIIGLVLSGLLVSLTAQVEQRNFNETEATIANIKEALLGYAMANGRFPCPAATPATGITAVEAFAAGGNATNGNCAGFFNGYVPSVTLGLSPTNTNGYVLDGWNNPIRYAVAFLNDDATNPTYNVFTKSSGMKNANNTCVSPCSTGMSWIATKTLLTVCSVIAGGVCAANRTLTQNAVLIVYSTGKNTVTTGGISTDEAANLNGDTVFVSHEPFAAGANEFDDIVEWIPVNSVFAKLVQANQLP